MILEETARAVLREAQKSGADYAELFLEDNESTRIEMIDGKVESANYARISGAGVRVLLGTQSAYAYCADISEQSLMRRHARLPQRLARRNIHQTARSSFRSIALSLRSSSALTPSAMRIASRRCVWARAR